MTLYTQKSVTFFYRKSDISVVCIHAFYCTSVRYVYSTNSKFTVKCAGERIIEIIGQLLMQL